MRDASGTILPGAPVSFTSDQGNLGSSSGLTNADGEARTTLTTNRDTVVTATVIAGVTATTNVRIINAPTVTIATNTTTPGVGVGVNFTVTPGASTSGTPIQSATVNFGDGSATRNLGAISGATNVTHSFASPGSFVVTATVTDATGQQTSSSVSIVVQRIAPTVTLTPASSSIAVGAALAFSVTATSGAGGPPIQSVVVTMNPGGTVLYSGVGGGSFTRQFGTQGTFTLTATDTVGTTGTGSAVVTVSGFDVTLDASGAGLTCAGTTYPKTCTGLAANTNVTFTAATTTAGVTVASYQWTWGDGTPVETTTSRINSHAYASAGNFVATVIATTTTGATASQSLNLKAAP